MAYVGRLKQSTARNASIKMVRADDHVTGIAGLTLTITASKDGAAFSSITPTVTDLGNGIYSLALTTTHTNTLGDLVLHVTGGVDALDADFTWSVEDFAASSVTGAVGSVTGSVGSIATGGITAGSFAAGAIDNAAIATDAIGSAELAASAASEIAAAVWDLTRSGHSTSGTFGEGVASVIGNVGGNVSGSVGSVVGSVGGNVAGQVNSVFEKVSFDDTAMANAVWDAPRGDHTGSGTFGEGCSSVQGSVTGNVEGHLLGHVAGAVIGSVGSVTDPQSVVDGVWDADRADHTTNGTFGQGAASVQGNVTGSVGSVAGSVASIASGGISAASFAAGAIDAAALATDAVTEIVAGIMAYAHESGRTVKGLFRRLDAIMTGKATGLIGALATFYRSDGTTVAIQATQDVALGTRETASTVGGD